MPQPTINNPAETWRDSPEGLRFLLYRGMLETLRELHRHVMGRDPLSSRQNRSRVEAYFWNEGLGVHFFLSNSRGTHNGSSISLQRLVFKHRESTLSPDSPRPQHADLFAGSTNPPHASSAIGRLYHKVVYIKSATKTNKKLSIIR